jgi:predicted nucleic acid-binding protein
LYPLLDCYVPDESDGIAAAMLQVVLRRQGWQLKTVDALIAAVAIHHDLILLTTDRDFLAVSALQCENWLTSTQALNSSTS